MGVEIGTLVLRGQFGTGQRDAQQDTREQEKIRAQELEALRRQILSEMSDMLETAQRPHWER